MKKILFVTSECEPMTGNASSLGEVSRSLSRMLYRCGFDIRVITPLYASVSPVYFSRMEYIGSKEVSLSWRKQKCDIYSLNSEGVTYYFIKNENYFDRENLFGYLDDNERFAYFCKAVVDTMDVTGFYPDLIHANDWQSALVPVYLRTLRGFDERETAAKLLFTVQHVDRQGKCPVDMIEDLLGISHHNLCILENSGKLNFMKGAIVVSDKITTVSPNYARELESSSVALGLENVIQLNSYKIGGILHGINYKKYNPLTDGMIYENYDADSIEKKTINKLRLQEELCLKQRKNVPMISMITKLVSKKGVDTVKTAIGSILEKDVQFLMLGQGDEGYENFFSDLESRYPTKMRTILMRSDEMAHKIYAGSDFFLMPSQSEPCGRSQMIASRYGTVPIVRKTGGLADSIIDVSEGGNGYVFLNNNGEELLAAVDRALEGYGNAGFREELIKRVMKTDFSWEKAAWNYASIYREMLG